MTSTLELSEWLEDDGRKAQFNTAIDALIDEARGWKLGSYAVAAHTGRVPDADGGAIAVQRLLDELCVDLGFCLPQREQARLRDWVPSDVDGFTDAVFAAEGMDPGIYGQLRRQVRARVAAHFTDDQGPTPAR
jgi:hypothetical protein